MDDWELQLAGLLREFDERADGFDTHDVFSAVSRVAGPLREAGALPDKIASELLAFAFNENHSNQHDGWGTYYGPMMSFPVAGGGVRESPSLSEVTQVVIDNWTHRARESRHPCLRIRYADLVWDLGQKVPGTQRDPDMPRIMIDAAVEIASRYPANSRDTGAQQPAGVSEIDVIDKLCRALEVALRIRDEQRVQAVRDAILAFEDRTAVDHLPGLWGRAFDFLIEENSKVPLSDAQRDKIIADLEGRLARLSMETDPNQLDPHVVQGATLRLARHYRRAGRTADVARVMAVHADAYLRKMDVVQPLVAAAWLRDLHQVLESFHLHAEAEQALLRYREFARRAAEQMHPMTVSTALSNDELEDYLHSWVESDEWDAILARLVGEYLPHQGAAEQEVRSTSRSFPLASMFGRTIVGQDGRAVAEVGTVENDLEGNIVQHISRDIGFRAPFLRLVIERLVAARGFGPAQVGGFLDGCPLFEPEKRRLLDEGIRAHFERRWAVAVHLLAPQIEAAIRRLVELAGGSILKAAKNGAFHLNNLDELLRRPEAAEALTADGARYLQILLTDQRGWNVRNDVCHGILPADHFGAAVADRLLHAVLLIGCIRACETSDTAATGSNSSPAANPLTSPRELS